MKETKSVLSQLTLLQTNIHLIQPLIVPPQSVQFQVRQHGVSLSDEKKLVSHVKCVFSSEQVVSEESLHLRNEASSFVELLHVHSTLIVVKKNKLNSSQRTPAENLCASIRWNLDYCLHLSACLSD